MSTLSDWYRRAAVRIPEVARPHRYGHDGSGGTVDWFPDTDVSFPLRLIDRSPSVEGDGHQGRRSCTVIAIPESLAAMAPFLRQSLMALLTLPVHAADDGGERLRQRFFAPLRLNAPSRDPGVEPVLYLSGEALCRYGRGRWMVDTDLLRASARALRADRMPMTEPDEAELQAAAARGCSTCVVDCTEGGAELLTIADRLGMTQWTMAYREDIDHLVILVRSSQSDGWVPYEHSADLPTAGLGERCGIGRTLLERIRRDRYPGLEDAQWRLYELEQVADLDALNRFADIWWRWFGHGGTGDEFRHELGNLVAQFVHELPEHRPESDKETLSSAREHGHGRNRGRDYGRGRGYTERPEANIDILIAFAALLCDGVYIDTPYEFMEAMDARLLRAGERRRLYDAVQQTLHDYWEDNIGGAIGARSLGRRWKDCQTELEHAAMERGEVPRDGVVPERSRYAQYLECTIQKMPSTDLMYHERTVLSTFALCFLAKILVDASYEGERGAAVPVDIVAALTNDLSLRQWRTLVRYMLRMMLGIRSQQRERQALRMLEVSYRHVVGNDSLYCNGFDADECRDREQVGWNLVRLSLGFDFNLGGQWPVMWADCMLEGGTNRHQLRVIDGARADGALLPGNLRVLRRMAVAEFENACNRYLDTADAGQLDRARNAVWLELIVHEGAMDNDLREAVTIAASVAGGSDDGIGGVVVDGDGWRRQLHAMLLIDLAAWCVRQRFVMPQPVPRAVAESCLMSEDYRRMVLAVLGGEPVSVPGASSAEGDCGTVEEQVGRCWVSSASSAAEDEVRLKREALYRAACEPFQQLVLRNAFAGQCRALLAVVDAACSALLRRRARPDTARYTLDAPAVPPSVPSREVQRAMLMHILTPFMAVLAFALYALAAAGHDGSEGAREVLEGLRIRCGNDCDVRAVWNECLQWSLEADPTEGRWQKRRTRLYCLVAGYYLRFENDTEYERYLEKTPFRRCGSDGVLLSAAFQQLEFAVPVG